MKVTFLTTQQSYWGGSEVLWIRSVELAIVKGHEVQVVVFSQQDGLHPDLEKLRKLAHSFVEIKNDLLCNSLTDKIIRRVKNKVSPYTLSEISTFNPARILISQASNYGAAFNALINQFLTNTKIPFYLVSQFNNEHHCLTYSDMQKARVLLKKAAGCIFVSNRNKEVTERQVAQKIENATIIDNPLNLVDVEYLEQPQITSEVVCFASVARLEANFKGQDVLFQVLGQPQWKSRDWLLNIYGTGPDEDYLKELAVFYGINNKVKFHGFVNDIKNVWRNNHALLMPSVAEGKPLALEEAMICGRVAIASDVAGNAELVDDGVNGYIASSFFPGPFGGTMEKAWAERALWKMMGYNAHQKMMEKLDFNPHETILKIAGVL